LLFLKIRCPLGCETTDSSSHARILVDKVGLQPKLSFHSIGLPILAVLRFFPCLCKDTVRNAKASLLISNLLASTGKTLGDLIFPATAKLILAFIAQFYYANAGTHINRILVYFKQSYSFSVEKTTHDFPITTQSPFVFSRKL